MKEQRLHGEELNVLASVVGRLLVPAKLNKHVCLSQGELL